MNDYSKRKDADESDCINEAKTGAASESQDAFRREIRAQMIRFRELGESVPTNLFEAAGSKPGEFHRQHDTKGRMTVIEGWVDRKSGPRDNSEIKAQKEFRDRLPEHRQHQEASHILANMFGGSEKDNLVGMNREMNRSYYGSLEKALDRDIDKAEQNGESVYVRCEVSWGDDEFTPDSVRLQSFSGETKDSELTKIRDDWQKVDWSNPEGKTLAQTLNDTTGEKVKDYTDTHQPRPQEEKIQ